MKRGKVEFLNTIKRPAIGPRNKVKYNLSNNEAVYGKYKHYPDTWPLYMAFADEWSCETNCVLPTRGAEEALKLIYSVYAEAGTKVLRADPVFGMIEHYEELNRVEAIKIDYFDMMLCVDHRKYIKAINDYQKELSLVYLALPDNPTGDLMSPDDVESIVKTAGFFNIPVVLDCTYIRYNNTSNYNFLFDLRYPNVIIVDSLSKSYGLAGLRVGAVIANPDIIIPIRNLRPMEEVNSLAVKEGVKALKSNIAEKNRRHVNKWKIKFHNTLNDVYCEYISSQGNFMVLRYEDDKHIYFYHKLRAHGIETRTDFNHPAMKNVLRISIGNNRVMRKVLRLLKENK